MAWISDIPLESRRDVWNKGYFNQFYADWQGSISYLGPYFWQDKVNLCTLVTTKGKRIIAGIKSSEKCSLLLYRNHQIGCFSPLRSSPMQNKGTRVLVPDSFLWKIHECFLPMPGMRKYYNSSFEDKTNWLVWWYKNGKKRVCMNLLESCCHINHL